ncbi:hypothetical protein BDY21DRAFT_347665 [Lineolata rhizophorae]|uniref:C2H2-type domain-containing protein n=1 Tax=Lineolata rhizophorae TaxID=578093 RepID=A0A6A6NY16_9PEZI|nr:hypothetical protein BDY21DRAFT_347665 [Lineolata rhizophorae]
MSSDAFLRAISIPARDPHGRGLVDEILQAQLEDVAAAGGGGAPDRKTSACPLTEIGDFLTRASAILSHLADSLVNSDHVNAHIGGVLHEIDKTNDFSELDVLEEINRKHNSLRSICESLQKSAKVVRGVWNDVPAPTPECDPHVFSRSAEQVSPEHTVRCSSSPESMQHHEDSDGSLSQPSALADERTSSLPLRSMQEWEPTPAVKDINMEALNTRGKGSYICPHGAKCNKGGVRPSGELVVFERNSEFRAHLQKHTKAFRCELRGCRNKKGFARIDQLRRHQQMVRHD